MELRRDISRVIRQIRPELMLIPSPTRNWARLPASHPDHLAAGEAAINAIYPDARNPFAHKELLRLRIDGHTDDRGNAVDNLDLSLARAQLVRRWLIDNGRVDAARLTAQGFGGERPLVDNGTAEKRARNRRVEVIVPELAR